jgi:NRE family putative nickel resistance protein-like MFS transporter
MNADAAKSKLWSNGVFQKLYWAHVVSLVGSGVTSLALGLLAHELVGASASSVLGYTLAIRILVIVLFSPWAGQMAARFGARAMMIWSDLFRVLIVAAFFFVDAVWQVYVLAFFLNLGSAIFTPIYKAVIPGVVTTEDYPKAVAWGSIAYDTATILGPTLAGFLIATVGFRGSFFFDALTFLVSAFLLFILPRAAVEAPAGSRVPPWHGVGSMFKRPSLRKSLLYALQVSIGGAFVLVATVGFVKSDLGMSDTAYAWVMASFGIGSVCGALGYSKASKTLRDGLVMASAPVMVFALGAVALSPVIATAAAAWWFVGAAYSILGVRGSEILAANSTGDERPHIYAAHFALSHAGWGITYPLAGTLVTVLGFSNAAWIFAGLLVVAAMPTLFGRERTAKSAS